MLTPEPCSAWLIAYDIANVLTHSPKRIPAPSSVIIIALVPVGQPPSGFVTVPSDGSNVYGGVVVGLSGAVVSVANAAEL